MTTHFLDFSFFFFFSWDVALWYLFIRLTSSWKVSSILILSLADVSKKGHCQLLANSSPSPLLISLWASRSHYENKLKSINEYIIIIINYNYNVKPSWPRQRKIFELTKIQVYCNDYNHFSKPNIISLVKITKITRNKTWLL